MELHAIGIDLGKTVFHLVGLNQPSFLLSVIFLWVPRNGCPRPKGSIQF
jgi:hypothetical protein